MYVPSLPFPAGVGRFFSQISPSETDTASEAELYFAFAHNEMQGSLIL
jgi:hypothetical protein